MLCDTSLSEYISFSSKIVIFPKIKIVHKNHKYSLKEDVNVNAEM